MFTVKSSALSLSTVAVSWAMTAQFLAVAVARFAIASTISCCRYPSSGRAVALCAADCREWNQRTADNKTLPDLKTFFAAAHREWRLSLQNKTGTPYGARTTPRHAQRTGAYSKRW